MPEYYVDRATYDAQYAAKQAKRRAIILAAVLAAALILDILIYFLCADEFQTIINLGGQLLTVDKLMFVVATGIAEAALAFVGFMNQEKRLSFIVWDCLILIIMLVGFFQNL